MAKMIDDDAEVHGNSFLLERQAAGHVGSQRPRAIHHLSDLLILLTALPALCVVVCVRCLALLCVYSCDLPRIDCLSSSVTKPMCDICHLCDKSGSSWDHTVKVRSI